MLPIHGKRIMKVKRRAGSRSVFHHLGSNTITSLQGKPPISEAKNPSIQPLQEGHPFLLKPRHSLLKATGQLNFLPEWSGKGFWEHIAFQTMVAFGQRCPGTWTHPPERRAGMMGLHLLYMLCPRELTEASCSHPTPRRPGLSLEMGK